MVNIETNEIEKMLNNYFSKNRNDFFVNNYGWLYKIAYEYLKIMPNRCSEDYMNVLDSRMPIYSDLEIFEFVREYLKKYNIKLDFDGMLKENKVVMNNDNISSFERWLNGINLGGVCNYKIVKVNSNVAYTDAVVLVHELSHYRTKLDRNSKINFNNQRWYGETLAIAEEFIMLDSSLNVEKQYIYLNRLNIACNRFNLLTIYLKMALVCKKYGNISKEKYLKVWKIDNYDLDLINFKKLYTKFDDEKSFFKFIDYSIKYSIATIIALHLMYNVRKNSDYMNKLENMHELVHNCSANKLFAYFDLLPIVNDAKQFCEPVEKVIKEIIIYSKVNEKSRI